VRDGCYIRLLQTPATLGPGHRSDWRLLNPRQDSRARVCACASKRRAEGAPWPAILRGLRIGRRGDGPVCKPPALLLTSVGAARAAGLVTIDLDGTIVTAFSEKSQPTPTWKETFGFHLLAAFADHGAARSGEPLAIVLRSGNAGSNIAAGHIEATRLALARLPRHLRRKVLIRADSGGGTHELLSWLARPGYRLHYSAGMTISDEHPGHDPQDPRRRVDTRL
jgi:hypothetical protein